MSRLADLRSLPTWLREERRRRLLHANVARDVTPPPGEAYGAMGARSVVVPPSRVTRPDRIFLGDDVTVLEHAFLSVVEAVEGHVPTLRIGSGTQLGRMCHIACVGEIDIGPEVLTAERIFIGDTYHGYEDPTTPVIRQPMAEPEPVRIERGAFLGIGCVVLMGVTVGEHAYVAAGSVVTRDVPDHSLVVGNPARVVRTWNAETRSW